MATTPINKATVTINADTNANAGTLVQRDGSGGVLGNTITANTSLVTAGTFVGTVVTETSNFTAGAATHYLCDTSGGSITVTLPTAASNAGVVYLFFKTSGSNTLTFTGVTGTGSLSSVNTKVTIFCDGTNWYSA